MARQTLETLIRLAGVEVDRARVNLQQILAEEDILQTQMDDLARSVEQESRLAGENPEFGRQFGTFIAYAKRRREELVAAKRKLQPRINASRAALADAFANQKRYEIAKQNRAEADAAEAARKEGIAMDELGLNAHRRKEGRNG